MFQQMGTVAIGVVVILFLMSIYLVAVSIERWFYFSRNRKRSMQIVLAMRDIVEDKGSALEDFGDLAIKKIMVERYANASEKTKAKVEMKYRLVPLARVIEAASGAIRKRTKDLDALDLVVGINRAVERAVERQTSLLKRGFGGLATIATTAPFIGLFGTVVGIINAFGSIEQSKGLEGIAGGISEALVATALGLVVAIPAVALYNYFTGLADKMVIDMDEVASEMVEAVVLRDKKG